MNQLKFYQVIIVCLIGLNAVVLIFFYQSKPYKSQVPPNKEKRSEVIKMLNLDSQQAIQLNSLADEHTRNMNEFKEKQAKILSPYFISVIDSTKSVDIDSLSFHRYQEFEKAKIEMTYRHFQEIEELLRDEQQLNFQKFIRKTVRKVLFREKHEKE